jgi:HlyD family secretion protein
MDIVLNGGVMTKRKKIWIACGGVLLLAIIVAVSISSSRKNTVSVQTSKVQRKETLTSKVKASGEIRAKNFADLQSEVAGIITDLPVHEGDKVKKGDVLLRIDPIQNAADSNSRRAQYEASLADARAQQFLVMNAEANLLRDEASLRSARADLQQAENNFARAQSSYTRQQQLHEDGLISRDDYEIAQNDFRSAKSRLEVAKAQAEQMETQVRVARNNIEQNKTSAAASAARAKSAEADLARADDNLKKTTLYSPLDGVITQLLVEKGERAQPGIMSNPQATLMTIADLSVIQAQLKVDETDVVNLSLGDAAQVKVDALPDMVFDGEVTEIGNSPIQSTSGSTQQEAKDFKVIITLKNPSPKIRPGMSCTGEITTQRKHNVLVIPIQALTVRDVEVDKDGKYHEPDLSVNKKDPAPASKTGKENNSKKELEGVFVINQNKVARFRTVKTGITGESEIEVLENLKEGEEIVSGSFQTLRTIKDGAAVKTESSSKAQTETKS